MESKSNNDKLITHIKNIIGIIIKYLKYSIIDGIIIGVVNYLFMLYLEMPWKIGISILMGITNLFPSVGPVIGAIIGGVILDGSIPDDDVKRMIAESYDLVTDSPTKRIYEAVKHIPQGKVATYGQVAAMAGNPKMSRAVGNALHKNPDFENIPCYRVVNSKGELAGEYVFGGAWAQKELLEADGIVVENGKVDLTKYGMEIE